MREGPSGSGVITDERNVSIPIAQNKAAGVYYVGFEANVDSQFFLVSNPSANLLALANGIQTRAGRIGKAKAVVITDQNTNGDRADTIFQWVNIDAASGAATLAGKRVVIPWKPFAGSPVTLRQSRVQDLDFGLVQWQAGGLYVLQVTIGAILANTPGQQTIQMTYETVYGPRSPVIP